MWLRRREERGSAESLGLTTLCQALQVTANRIHPKDALTDHKCDGALAREKGARVRQPHPLVSEDLIKNAV